MVCNIKINLNYITNKESFIISVLNCLMNCVIQHDSVGISKMREISTIINNIAYSYKLCFCYQKEPIDMFIKDVPILQNINCILNIKNNIKIMYVGLKEYIKEPVTIDVIGKRPKYLNDVLIRDLCSDVIKLNFKEEIQKSTKTKCSKQLKQIKSNE